MADFNPDEWLAETAPQQSAENTEFDPDQWLKDTDYWGDVKKHAIEGVKEFPATAQAIGEQGLKIEGATGPRQLIQSGADILQGKPVLETPVGEGMKSLYEVGQGAWQGVKDTGSLAKSVYQYATDDEMPFAETEIGQKFRERPISVPLGIAGTVGGLRGAYKGLRGKSAVPKVLPEEIGVMPEGGTPKVPGVPPESPPVGAGVPPPDPGVPPGGAVPPPPTPPIGVEGYIKQFTDSLKPRAQDLEKFINRTYQRAEKGGMFTDAADYTQEASQLMAVRAVGGNPNFAIQARKFGKTPLEISDELRAIGQYIIDEDIIRPELGDKHMLTTQQRLMDEAGGRIGGVRLMADEMAPPVNYKTDIMQTLKGQFGRKLSKGQYKEAMEIVQKHKPTYKGMADASTELNYEANQANRNNQPHTPYTEVANVISQINNERIMATVGPDVAKVYNSALNEFGVNKKIQNFLARKVGQGLHRIGPGTLKRAAVQKFFDEIGYKGGARVLNRLAGNIKANPGLVKNLPELFKSFINEVDDLLPEVESKAFGGIVGEMDSYLTPRYGGTA